jgi:hypothetical protein
VRYLVVGSPPLLDVLTQNALHGPGLPFPLSQGHRRHLRRYLRNVLGLTAQLDSHVPGGRGGNEAVRRLAALDCHSVRNGNESDLL